MPNALQAEIKQSRPFPSPKAEAFLGILRTAAVLEHQLSEVLKPHGLTSTQYNVLRILRGAGKTGLCGRDIGERLVSQVPDIPRLLDRMEDLEMLQRERDPDDRRQVTARITAKGLKLLDQATPHLELVESTRLAKLNPRTIKTLIQTLDDIRAGG